MSFTIKQRQALQRSLHPSRIKVRESSGQQLSYIEGWYAVAEANRIFGFDGWSRETLESKCVFARENRGAFTAVYTAKVRITVNAGNTSVVREGHGTGEAWGGTAGAVHDTALKAAETDGTKRALITFGSRFGLMLYGGIRAQDEVRTGNKLIRPILNGPPPASKIEDTEKIGRREKASENIATSSSSLPDKIDKSVLTLGAPKRLRNRDHLRYVASQPCLICGRCPSDAHHLKFAQPRALGLKVSDEFTVPLCRGHHRDLHRAGNETKWWAIQKVDALAAARTIWTRTQRLKPHAINRVESFSVDQGIDIEKVNRVQDG